MMRMLPVAWMMSLAVVLSATDAVWLVPLQPTANEQGLIPARIQFVRNGSGYPLTVRYRISGFARSTLHGGSVAAIQLDSLGDNYVSPQVIGTLSGGGAPVAPAQVSVHGGSGSVSSITVINGGQNYYRVVSSQANGSELREPDPPRVVITGDGYGAVARALVGGQEQNFAVTAIEVLQPGQGYTYASISIIPNSGPGSGASATAVIAGTPVLDARIDARGWGYPLPTVSAVGGGGSGAVLRPVIRNGRLHRIAIEAPGSGYTSAPTIAISGGSGSGAAAVATIDEFGRLAAVTVTNGGSGYGPTIAFDDPLANQIDVEARVLLAGPDFVAPSDSGIDPMTGDLVGTIAFAASETQKTLDISPCRNGIGGAVSVQIAIEPSASGAYIVSQPQSVRIAIADADDVLTLQVRRPVAYPAPPSIESQLYPLEVQARGEWRVHVEEASHHRLRSVAMEVGSDPNLGPLVQDGEAWLAWHVQPIEETAQDYAFVVPKKPSEPEPAPGPGSTEIGVSRQLFATGDIVMFLEPTYVSNGIYQVTGTNAGKDDENPSIKIAPPLKLVQTAYSRTRVQRIAKLLATGNFASLRNFSYSSSSDFYFYLFPMFDSSAAPRARRSVLLQLIQSDDYRIVTPTVGSVVLADAAVTARIRHVSNAVRPTVSGVVEVEFSQPFPVPVQVPFRIVEPTTTARIGRPNTTDPADDVVIPGLDPATKLGRIDIPAGARVGYIVIQPNPLNVDTVFEQVTIQLLPSYDYLFGPLGTSPVNPTAVVSVAPVPMTRNGNIAYIGIERDVSVSEVDERAEIRIFLCDADGNPLAGDAVTEEIAVRIALSGSATAGADYEALEQTVVSIPAGANEARLRLNLINDDWVEDDETIIVTLQSGSGYLVSARTAGIIRLLDDEPVVSVQPPTSQPVEGGTSVSFTIQSSVAVRTPLSVRYQVLGTAEPGIDYAALTGEAKIPVGQRSVDVSIVAFADAIADGGESIVLVLLPDADLSPKYRIGMPSQAVTTILEPPPPPAAVLARATLTVVEGRGTAVDYAPVSGAELLVSLMRQGSFNPTVRIPIAVGGTALPGIDYQALPERVTIPGATVVQTAAAGASFILLQWDDEEVVRVPAGGTARYTLTQGDTDVHITVTFAAPFTLNRQPVLAVLESPLPIPIPAGSTLGINDVLLAVTPMADQLVEGEETVSVELLPGASNYVLGEPFAATVTIVDAKAMGVVTISADSRPAVDTPPARPASFMVSVVRDELSDNADIRVPLIVGGDAVPGRDYVALPSEIVLPKAAVVSTVGSGSTYLPLRLVEVQDEVLVPKGGTLRVGSDATALTVVVAQDVVIGPTPVLVPLLSEIPRIIPAGTSVGINTIMMQLQPIEDHQTEGTERVIISLAKPDFANFTLGSPERVEILIADRDARSPVATVTIASVTTPAVDDGLALAAGRCRISALRQGVSNPDIIVPLSISGTARPGIDYQELPDAIVLPELLTTVPADADATSMTVKLANPAFGAVSLPAGGRLRWGATTRVLVASPVTIAATPVTIQLAEPLTVSIPQGASLGVEDVLLDVQPIADQVDEGLESVTIVLRPAGEDALAPYTVGTPSQATIEIADVPLRGIVSLSPPRSPAIDSAPIQATGFIVTVQRVGSSNADIVVPLTVGGTATEGVDYQPLPTQAVLPEAVITAAAAAGARQLTLRLATLMDPVIIPAGGRIRVGDAFIARVAQEVTIGSTAVTLNLDEAVPFALATGTSVGINDILVPVVPIADMLDESLEIVTVSAAVSREHEVLVRPPSSAVLEIRDALLPPPTTAEVVRITPLQATAYEEGLIPARLRFERSGSGYPLTIRYRITGDARSHIHRGSIARIIPETMGIGYMTDPVWGAFIGGTMTTPSSQPLAALRGGSGQIGEIVVVHGGRDYYRVTAAETGGAARIVAEPPEVVIVGDGYGAQAEAFIGDASRDFSVTRIAVRNPGRGYTDAKVYLIPKGANGTGAYAEARIVGGPVSEVQLINRGYGYDLPRVLAEGGGGSGAVLRPVITDGRLTHVAVENGGSGYTQPPRLSVVGGSGTGAMAEAIIDAHGRVQAVEVRSPGEGYGPSVKFDDPSTTQEAMLLAKAVLAGPDYEAPPASWIDPETGDLIGLLTFAAAETVKVLELRPWRNGVSGARTAVVSVEPSASGHYTVDHPSSIKIAFADADDTVQVSVRRPVAYPTPPTLLSPRIPLEVQGRGEWVVSANGELRLRNITVEFGHDPDRGSPVADGECWLGWHIKPFEDTIHDYAVIVAEDASAESPRPGDTKIPIDRLIFEGDDLVFFDEPLSDDPVLALNGIYRVTGFVSGEGGKLPSITIEPALRRLVTTFGRTRVRKIGKFIASSNFAQLRSHTYALESDRYYFLFPMIGEHAPRARRSMMLQLVQSDDYRIMTPTTGTVILADDAVTARIRHVGNVVRPTVSGVVEVEFSRPFPVPVQVPFRIVESGTTATIGRMNSADPEDDVMIPGLDPETRLGRIEIPAGSTVGQIIIQPNPLNKDIALEQVMIQLMPSDDYLFGPLGTSPVNPTAVVSVAPVPTTRNGNIVYIGVERDVFASEADEHAEIRIFLTDEQGNPVNDDALREDIVVRFAVSGTATAGADYESLTQASVQMLAGQRETRLKINLINDEWVEDDETVSITLQTSNGYLVGEARTGTLRLSDDEPVITIVPPASRPVEGGAAADFIIRSHRPVNNRLTIAYRLDGTAEHGVDYDRLSGSAVIPSGQDFAMVSIIALTDAVTDPGEQVIITLLPSPDTPARYRLGAESSAMTEIDEPPTPLLARYEIVAQRAQVAADGTVTMVDAPAREGEATGAFTITAERVGPSNPDLVIPLIVSGTAVPGLDYEPLPTSVTLRSLRLMSRALRNQVFLQVQPVGGGEVALPAGGQLRVGDTTTMVQVRQAVAVPADGAYIELAKPLTIELPSGTVLGVCTAELAVVPIDDERPEGSKEVVVMIPGDSTGAGERRATVELQDNDGGAATLVPIATYAIAARRAQVAADGTVTMVDAPAREGEATGAFTITAERVGPSNPDLVIPLIVSGTAVPGLDYEPLPSSVTLRSLRLLSRALTGQSFLLVQPVGSGEVALPAGGQLRVGDTTTMVRVRQAVVVPEGGAAVELTAPLSSAIESGMVLGVCTAEVAVVAFADDLIDADETVILNIPADSTGQGMVSAHLRIIDTSQPAAPGDGGASGNAGKPAPSGSGGGGGCGAGMALLIMLGLAMLVIGSGLRRYPSPTD